MVHPAQGGRGHTRGAGAIAGFQSLLHQSDALEVFLLPVPEWVGEGTWGSVSQGH